ncbi:MAG: energy-coupling factor transporter transmembrane protein EcfT [Candidatus Marinimicrobia bacterium]|jgi:energy-coupling factor transporter transmembrane protein EcfT|nr:energy-coupling factor transporter transmembrane protein EcfT [Candidatus Neomarinimicrobiota bacterium]MEE3149768.1 energy-coupling factor transporter transmembrane component T [Candidatus Neomarinimicrobiota bacterium]
MNIHPLVRFIFFLTFSFSVLFADTLTLWAIYFGIFVVTTGFDRTVILAVFSRIKPFIQFFPIMLVIYLAMSIFFTDATIYQAMVEVGFAFLRIVLMISIMSLYFESVGSPNFLLALRSIWFQTGLKWNWMENFFLFLDMTLRFYPSLQRDWITLSQSRESLGFNQNNKRWDKIKLAAQDLPILLVVNLRKSQDIALAMQLRGFGESLPRCVYNATYFTTWHLLQFAGVIICFYLINLHAPL